MKFKNFLLLLVITSLSLFLFACDNNKTNLENTEKDILAVSIVPQESFLKEIVGDNFEIVTLIPPGNSPANYAPRPKEIEQLSKSKIYFSIGVPTEKANILPKLDSLNKDIILVDLESAVEEKYEALEFSEGKKDPHIWLSPKRVILIVEKMAEEVSLLDPENKEIYEENAKKYIERLEFLNKELEASIAKLENKSFIIYHPALGYFADDYGLKMYAIESEGKEATPKEIEAIIKLAEKENIRAIFYQAEIDSKQSQVIANEIGGYTQQVAPLDPNYIQNLQNILDIFEEISKK